MSISLMPPPPRIPSPQLVPASLPSPPPFPRRISSRSRLHLPLHPDQPPIPPRLVGSPLLDKLVHSDPATLTPKIQKQLWFDGDEFGTRRTTPTQTDGSEGFPFIQPSPPSTPRSASHRRVHRRTSSTSLAARTRSRSPPPPQSVTVSIPPVPPIPSSIFDNSSVKRPVLRTPPPTPHGARPAQISIPDPAVGASPPSPNGLPSPAFRQHSPRSRASARSLSLHTLVVSAIIILPAQ
ncbi:hypothetical protein BD310DRAFT_1035167 [Dichomitus squalens]|uniref:Uncharacterized protein n=1 Tax=Dichomitus squalens TaxID=114155 RepID=A0A4V2K9I2_9APHY|nr:hypothetical protein BD310DRAFT_1035167 [Dichomitus squalens]